MEDMTMEIIDRQSLTNAAMHKEISFLTLIEVAG